MKNLILQFPQCCIHLRTNYDTYYKYLQLYFSSIVQQDSTAGQPQVTIDICWNGDILKEHYRACCAQSSFGEIGANTLLGENKLVTIRKVDKRKKVCFEVAYDPVGKQFNVQASLHRKVFKDLVRYKLLRNPEENNFFSISYPLIYYPLFWYQELQRSLYVLHASMISIEGKGIIICGLEGVGKTSLSLGLMQELHASFYSDNLIFYDATSAYACYEAVRLNKRDKHDIIGQSFTKLNAFKTFKDFYVPKDDHSLSGIKPSIVIFPEFSNSFYVRRLTHQDAVNKALVLSYLPAELNNYLEYRSLFNLFTPGYNPQKEQCAVLQKLFSTVKPYVIGMSKTDGLAHNTQRVKEIISRDL